DPVGCELLARAGLDMGDSLLAFTLDVDADWRRRLPRHQHAVFEEWLSHAARQLLLDDDAGRRATEIDERARRATLEHGEPVSQWIQQAADTPLIWFDHLLGWLKAGGITAARLILRKRDGDGLLLDDDFSDGEFLLAGRYGLLLMLRESDDC